MTDNKTSLGMGFIMPTVGRIIIFQSCLALIILQIYEEIFVKANHDNYLMIAATSVVYLLGLLSAVTRNSKQLVMFGCTIIMLAFYKGKMAHDEYINHGYRGHRIFSDLKLSQVTYQWQNTSSNSVHPTSTWNRYQKSLKCCGLEGRSDWNEFRPTNLANDLMPHSCCQLLIDGLCRFENAFESDCTSAYFRKGKQYLKLCILAFVHKLALAGLAFGVARLKSGSSRTITMPQSDQTDNIVAVLPNRIISPCYKPMPAT